MSPRRSEHVGDRIRRYRAEKQLSISELAERADISKGYISNLERKTDGSRPSAKTLYAIASALGVTLADLMGTEPLVAPNARIPKSLREFAADQGLPESDVQMLATIQFRGEQPKTKERWRYIYDAIRMSSDFDKP